MEEVTKKITQILDQFFQEEYRNNLSQFAFMSLRSMIVAELNKLKKKEDEQSTSKIVR